jgi:GNAT superfamily N-acetyltransferase
MAQIVRAEEKHVTEIGKLWWEFMLFHEEIDAWFTPREGSIPGFEENAVRRIMQSEKGHVLVALDKDRVVGFSLSEIQGPSKGMAREKWGYIDTMAVTEACRRKGVGQKMLDEILAWFRSKGVERVELNFTAQNVVADSFWLKHGFKVYMHRLYKKI